MPELELFLPPEEISNRIKHIRNQEKPTLKSSTSYHIFTPNTELASFVWGLTNFVCDFYRMGEISNMSSTRWNGLRRILETVGEGVQNGLCHGGQELVILGLFLGDKGAAFSFKDFGNYFTRPDIKMIWESKNLEGVWKEKKEALRVGHASSGPGYGVRDSIFAHSDVIYVDNNQGALYCVQMRERFDIKS